MKREKLQIEEVHDEPEGGQHNKRACEATQVTVPVVVAAVQGLASMNEQR